MRRGAELSVFDFAERSRPLERTWLDRLSLKREKILIIGSGVTAKEYGCILHNAGVPYDTVDPTAKLDDHIKCKDRYLIVACPNHRKRVVDQLFRSGLKRGLDFNTYFELLRNRCVFDFRTTDTLLAEAALSRTLKSLESIATIGGIDVAIDSKTPATWQQLVTAISMLPRKYHTKISIEVTAHVDSELLENAPVDLVELIVRRGKEHFYEDELKERLYQSNKKKKYHVVFIDVDRWSRIDQISQVSEHDHPRYFDELIYFYESVMKRPVQSEGVCVSRRMFPIFDGRLKLKLCSLYGDLATTQLDVENLFGEQYIRRRNSLCSRCQQASLHRRC